MRLVMLAVGFLGLVTVVVVYAAQRDVVVDDQPGEVIPYSAPTATPEEIEAIRERNRDQALIKIRDARFKRERFVQDEGPGHKFTGDESEVLIFVDRECGAIGMAAINRDAEYTRRLKRLGFKKFACKKTSSAPLEFEIDLH